MITVMLNGEVKEVPEGTSLARLLELLGLPTQRIAVEVNREVVRRGDWNETFVHNSDAIEVVHFVGGG